MRNIRFVRWFSQVIALVAIMTLFALCPTWAQTTGYAVEETASAPLSAETKLTTTQSLPSTKGPVRLARFSFTQGDVTWRQDDNSPWLNAYINQPICQGAEMAVGPGGRAEIQLDDGSCLRLGNGAIIVLQLLFSDAEGEFTQIKLTKGLASLSLKQTLSVYQVDTPLVSVKAAGPARLRIGVSEGVEVALREGSAVVEGAKGKVVLKGGDYLDLVDENSPYTSQDLPAADSWETWCDDRDQMLDDAQIALARRQVPPDIAMVAGNLDAYGTWQTDVNYGAVWRPRVSDAGWRPYFAGRWEWVNAFGWTWRSDEAWGWAPYHYGAWFHTINGWEWKPGPAHQFWSPAAVRFTEYNGNIAWCPLAPSEIKYPTQLSVGVFGSDWPNYFSIGAAGYFSAKETFVPVNARSAAGVTATTKASFASRGAFTQVIAGSTNMFVHGSTAKFPASTSALAGGPQGVQTAATPQTSSPLYGSNNTEKRDDLLRPVFHMPVPPNPVHTGVVVVRSSRNGSDTKSAVSPGGGNRISGSTSDTGGSKFYGGARNPAGTTVNGAGVSGTAPSSAGAGGNRVSAGSAPPAAPNPAGSGSVGRVSPSGTSGSASSGAPSPAGGNGTAHASGGAPASPAYHVGGGAPAGGGNPVRK